MMARQQAMVEAWHAQDQVGHREGNGRHPGEDEAPRKGSSRGELESTSPRDH